MAISMVSYYLDDLHKQIYVITSNYGATTELYNQVLRVGLSDLVDLPGQSTWYIRQILFKACGYQAPNGVHDDTRFRLVGGFMNRNISDEISSLAAFQEINGFPAKGVVMKGLLFNTPQTNWWSWQRTYKPSKNLTLNREQDVVFTMRNLAGNAMVTDLSIFIHAERGD
jgi:hypothetical protein